MVRGSTEDAKAPTLGRRSLPAFLAAAALLALALFAPAAPAATLIAGQGTGAGQVNTPESTAFDPSSGILYVGDGNNFRVDEFDPAKPAGERFIRAFGWGVRNGVEEPQTCTALTGCLAGRGSDHNNFKITAAGRIAPAGMAVNPVTHNIYVSDFGNYRVEEFTPAGEFVLTFGHEVDKTTNADVCTAASHDTCGEGVTGSGPGAFDHTANTPYMPLAFDPSGHLWVGDVDRLEEFSSAGVFLSEVVLPAVGEVPALAIEPASGDFYTLKRPSGESSETQGITPPASGTYTLTFEGQTTKPIAASASDIEVREALEALSSIGTGNLKSFPFRSELQITFVGPLVDTDVEEMTATGGATVTTLHQGNSGTPGVLTKLKPNGEAIETLDAAGHPVALGLDPSSGKLFVSDQRDGGLATLLEFAPSGEQLEAFGAGEVLGSPARNTLSFGGGEGGSVYVAGAAVQSFPLPPAGPLSRSLSAHPVRGTSATLRAILNPENAEAHYRFQYLTRAQYEADGNHFGAGTQETAEEATPASFEEPEVSAPISGLSSETAYRFRLLATNANGKGNTEEAQAEFTTTPPVSFDSLSASAVSAEGATLEAAIDPIGTPSEYHFEYITAQAAKQNEEEGHPAFTGASLAPVPDASLPGTEEDVSVSQTIAGLTAHTVYRYRAFAHNSGGSIASGSLSFTTQSTAPFSLLDGRGWELVSPPNKHGALLQPIQGAGVAEAAADGNSIAYLASGPTEAEPAGFTNQVQVLSGRGSGGWSSHDIAPPHGAPSGVSVGKGQEYRAFSADLTHALLQPFGGYLALSPQSTEQTPYLRTDFPAGKPSEFCAAECYRPLATAAEGVADVKPGVEFGLNTSGESCPPAFPFCGPEFVGATPDLSHIVLDYTPSGLTSTPEDAGGLYEWSSAAAPTEALKLVSILPTNKPGGARISEFGFPPDARGAISADGSRIVWSFNRERLYLRDTSLEQTVRIDAKHGGSGAGQPKPLLQGASADGSRIFFTDEQALLAGSAGEGGPDLYECAVTVEAGKLKCTLTDLTPKAGEESANVLGLIPGTSEDGSYVYLAASGVLAHNKNAAGEEATPGNCVEANSQIPKATCNLYLLHNGTTTFIATLSGLDNPDWGGEFKGLTARVSPNGRWLAFMSQRPLTGYDNRDAVSGKRDEEVFLYHAEGEGEEGKLVCASCNPSGARPHGVEYRKIEFNEAGLAGGEGVWPSNTQIAANIPGWTAYENRGSALYQSRYLSNQGRLFFNAADSLVPADSNGTEDVYEFEPPSGGETSESNDCSESSPTFTPEAEGCVDLISSGSSGQESAFLDASESGDDVFFLTSAHLSPRDEDTAVDLYDARVGGGEEEEAKPVECIGDACQQPATPPNDATPGSLSYSGPGNVSEGPSAPRCAKGKVKRKGACVAKKPHHKHPKKHKRRASHGRRAGR